MTYNVSTVAIQYSTVVDLDLGMPDVSLATKAVSGDLSLEPTSNKGCKIIYRVIILSINIQNIRQDVLPNCLDGEVEPYYLLLKSPSDKDESVRIHGVFPGKESKTRKTCQWFLFLLEGMLQRKNLCNFDTCMYNVSN